MLVVRGPELVTVHPPPPTSSLIKSGIILFRVRLGMILAMLPEKNWDEIWVSAIFQNGRHENQIWTISPVPIDIIIIIILVSKPMFSGSKNRKKPLIKILGYSYVANLEKPKMAVGKNRFMTKSQYLNIENQI